MSQATTSWDRRALRALLLAALCYLAVPVAAPVFAQLPRLESQKAELVVVRKSKRVLHLIRGGRPFKTYLIAWSGARWAQAQGGDGRTPEGVYTRLA